MLLAFIFSMLFDTSECGCATIYESNNYGGASLKIQPGEYFNCLAAMGPGNFNDRASSVKVNSGCTLTAWEHCDKSGYSRTYSQNDPSLADSNDFSSLSCYCETSHTGCGNRKCGLAARSGERIAFGENTEVNEYPWMAEVFKKSSNRGHGCGGSLISDQWVLTAAHCFVGHTADQLEVVLGEHDKNDNGEATSVWYNVLEYIPHEQFDNSLQVYDAALLKLEKPVYFNIYPHISPVCLPEDLNEDYANYPAVIIGWGKTETGSYSAILQEGNAKVLPNSNCNINPPIADENLCTEGDDEENTCSGDSGGPVVTAGIAGDGVTPGQNYELIGVVTSSTSSTNCGLKNGKSVHARITKLMDWIMEKTSGSWHTCPRT